jgi:hypothetical protein
MNETRLCMFPDLNDSRRPKIVPFLQKVLALGQLEEVNIEQVLNLANEMGLKRSYLEHALLSPNQQIVLNDQINEVSHCTSRTSFDNQSLVL